MADVKSVIHKIKGANTGGDVIGKVVNNISGVKHKGHKMLEHEDLD